MNTRGWHEDVDPTTNEANGRQHASSLDSALSVTSSSANRSPSATSPSPSLSIPEESKICIDSIAPLDTYISLGSLTFPTIYRNVARLNLGDQWAELRSQDADSDDQLSSDLGIHLVRLLRAQWVRLFVWQNAGSVTSRVKILLLPEDVGHASIDKSGYRLRQSLRQILHRLGQEDDGMLSADKKAFQPFASRLDGQDYSLWYLFNVICSPRPDPAKPQQTYDRAAMCRLLNQNEPLRGLKTRLYPFQTRSAAVMVQKETAPELYLDPRFEERMDQDGKAYFYSPQDTVFHSQPRFYEENRGGILAESMGMGKTLICLAVILATRSHLPRIPAQYFPPPQRRAATASLYTTAAACAARHSLPWAAILDNIELDTNVDTTVWRQEVMRNVATYEIPVEPVRFNRAPTKRLPRKLSLCSGTLIVVPRALFDQWKYEIEKHVDQETLRVLFMDKPSASLPTASELARYDIVLFSRTRFQLEVRDGEDNNGRRQSQGPQKSCACPYIGSTRVRDCTCFRQEDLYISPLKQLHWLRLIVDEGHAFSSSDANAVRVADQLVAERRWAVSGTPAKSLIGVDIDQTTMDFTDDLTAQEMRLIALEDRKAFSRGREETESAKSIGVLASKFLKVHPWAFSTTEGAAKWEDYIYRHEDPSKRTFSGYTTCLSRTLERLIVKTRPEDVERDLVLPPFTHNVVRLAPSYFDKMTTNLFVHVMRGNAITSERVDRDYLFHKDNEKPRHELIRNLRQASFVWTGFREADVHSTIDICTKYLEKNDTTCSVEDRVLLQESLASIQQLLDCPAWKAMSNTHELGLYVESWPSDYCDLWALDANSQPGLYGLGSVYRAQMHINTQDGTHRLDSFASAALKSRQSLAQSQAHESPNRVRTSRIEMTRTGVPLSSITDQTGGTGRRTSSTTLRRNVNGKKSNRKRAGIVAKIAPARPEEAMSRPRKRKAAVSSENDDPSPAKLPRIVSHGLANESEARTEPPPTTPDKSVKFAVRDSENKSESSAVHGILKKLQSLPSLTQIDLAESVEPADSNIDQTANLDAFQQARAVGTTSAKATYLIDKFVRHCPTEKILVFFDCVSTARYIQDILDFLHIGSRHFAYGLRPEERSRNKDAFQNDPRIRVLLIDVRLGGEGLDLNAASLVLIVNPICQPALEAQAIKRAHRIGQDKRVLVETLVLEGTIEEQLFEQSKGMTQQEFRDGFARHEGIKELLLNAKIIPVYQAEQLAARAMAPLAMPQQVFMRESYKDFEVDLEDVQNGSRKVACRKTTTSDKGKAVAVATNAV